MSSIESRRSRLSSSLLALAAAVALTAAFAAPASAVKGQGNAVIVAAQHDKGRTLSGQGVKLSLTGGTVEGNKLTVPIAEVNPAGPKPSATSSAILSFSKSKKAADFADLHFNLSAGTLDGKYEGAEVPIFRVEGAPQVNSVSGAVSLDAGKLRLIDGAANAIADDLDLARKLNRKGIGMVWLAVQANPTHGPAQKVTSGSLNWGFLTSWREYIYKNLGPGSVGSITTEGGATTVGEPSQPGSYFSFPATGGTYHEGLYGASDTLTLDTKGSVKFAKPGHCIVEIKFENIVATIGTSSKLVANLNYDIGQFNGKGCTPLPAVSLPNTEIAALGSVTPTYGANQVSWNAIPATLSAAAAKPFEPTYKAGQALDPVTITVGIG